MSALRADCVVEAGNVLGESPVWCDRTQRLYWVDSRGPAMQWLDPATGAVGRRSLSETVGSIALRESAGFIVALQSGFHAFDLDTGALERIVDPEPEQPDNRLNDGRVDRAGRFWAGTMSDVRRDPTGALYRLDPDGCCARIFGDVIVPNSIAWSPDSQWMYFADTYRQRIVVFPFDLNEGRLGPCRLFRDTTGQPGRPDGSAVDVEGCLWNAEYGGSRVVRYTPDGTIDRVIELPVANPTCCVFGGSSLDTLFITSASQRLTPDQLARQPLAGSLFAVSPGVSGLPESRFGG